MAPVGTGAASGIAKGWIPSWFRKEFGLLALCIKEAEAGQGGITAPAPSVTKEMAVIR